MKFNLLFKSNKDISGVNTLHIVQAWLFQNFERVDSKLTAWLHDEGYFIENKKMKPLNFSPLYKTSQKHIYGIKVSSLDKNVLRLITQTLVDPLPLTISLKNGNAAELKLENIKIKRFYPWRYGTKFFTLSPIILKDQHGFVKLDFENPDDVEKARQIIENNLAWKYKALYGEECTGGIEYFIPKKMNPSFYTNFELNTGQKIPLTGYTGEFLIHGDMDLIRVAYYCGIGAKNACGFGCVEQVKFL